MTSSWGGRRYLPYAFTEHDALMLGNVLKSEQAVEMSLMVVRAFVHMRELLAGNKELAQKLNQLERKVGAHEPLPKSSTPSAFDGTRGNKEETHHRLCAAERYIEQNQSRQLFDCSSYHWL